MLLNVREIALGYPKNQQVQPILEQCSFEVGESSLTTILGPSGVGKSSLLRVLAGLDKPISGRVELFGQTINQPHPEVGFVFQSPSLLPWLNVKQNVAFGLDFAQREKISKAEIAKRVDAALEEVGLTEAKEAMPSELSGGMAQRVNLARALARQPKLILLDEPFSALDAVIRGQMQQLLSEIVRHHQAAAVMITHDIDEALAVSDDILLLGGKPASIQGRWHLTAALPREDLLSLNTIRVDILQTLRRHQQRTAQEATIDFII